MLPTPTTTAASISIPFTEALRRWAAAWRVSPEKPGANGSMPSRAKWRSVAIAAVGSANRAPKRRGSRKRSLRPEANRNAACS